MIRCKTCDTGQLIRKKKYRMSGIVVFIGYILLIPSAFGLLIGILMLFATGSGTGVTMESSKARAQTKLEAAGIPTAITTKVISFQQPSEAERNALTASQRQTVDEVALEFSASTVGAGLGATIMGGVSAFVLISALVGGLLGWLLVMRKSVLQCTKCSAVTAAS